MDIILRTNQQDPFLALRAPHRFADGSGAHATLEVQSRGFQVRRPFYFEDHPLAEFLDQLVRMERTLKGSARLKPLFEADFIEMELTHRGRLIVRGELFEHSEHSQHLRFEFDTDQTVLKPLIDDLQREFHMAAA